MSATPAPLYVLGAAEDRARPGPPTNAVGQRLGNKYCPDCETELQKVYFLVTGWVWRCPWWQGGGGYVNTVEVDEYGPFLACRRPMRRDDRVPVGWATFLRNAK